MILSEQTFIELAGKQEVLDAKIKAAKGITELPLERIELAYRVEAAECVNEMKGDMKYWSDKPMNREAFIEEFVDALHFFLSFSNLYSKEIDGSMGLLFDLLVHDYKTVKMRYEKEQLWKIASCALRTRKVRLSFAALTYLVERYDFAEQDIIDTYNRKNAVNHDRSDSGVY